MHLFKALQRFILYRAFFMVKSFINISMVLAFTTLSGTFYSKLIENNNYLESYVILTEI